MIGSPSAIASAAPCQIQSGRSKTRVSPKATPTTASEAKREEPVAPARETSGAPPPPRPAVTLEIGVVEIGVVPPVGVLIAASRAAISSAVWIRSAGFFSRHRSTRSFIAGGIVFR